MTRAEVTARCQRYIATHRSPDALAKQLDVQPSYIAAVNAGKASPGARLAKLVGLVRVGNEWVVG